MLIEIDPLKNHCVQHLFHKLQKGRILLSDSTLAIPSVTCRHALQNILEYLLGNVALYQIHFIAVYVIMFFKKVPILIQNLALLIFRKVY